MVRIINDMNIIIYSNFIYLLERICSKPGKLSKNRYLSSSKCIFGKRNTLANGCNNIFFSKM